MRYPPAHTAQRLDTEEEVATAAAAEWAVAEWAVMVEWDMKETEQKGKGVNNTGMKEQQCLRSQN